MCTHILCRKHTGRADQSPVTGYGLARLGFIEQLTKTESSMLLLFLAQMLCLFTLPTQADVLFSSAVSAASWESGRCWRSLSSARIFEEEGFPLLLLCKAAFSSSLPVSLTLACVPDCFLSHKYCRSGMCFNVDLNAKGKTSVS